MEAGGGGDHRRSWGSVEGGRGYRSERRVVICDFYLSHFT